MFEYFFGKQERNKSKYVTVTALVDDVATQIEIEYYTLYSSRFRKGRYVITGNFPKLGYLFIRESNSFFHSLFKLREQLENKNILLCVWGAKRSVWPSGMVIDMGGGFFAIDRDSNIHVSNFILKTVDSNEVVTTVEQYEYITKNAS